MSGFRFLCSSCGEWHDELPDLAFRAPVYWNEAAALANPADHRLGDDLCIVGDDRFIRCILLVPIRAYARRLGWGVWVTQSQENFELYEGSVAVPELVTFGYLANRLPLYPDTLNMAVQTHWTTDGKRPWVELEPSEHPLYCDWLHGITADRAIKLAELVLHQRPHGIQ